jgi:hypothetical protein
VLLLDLLDVRQPARRSQELQTRTAPTQKRASTRRWLTSNRVTVALACE